MIQFLFKLILCVLLAIAAAFAYVAVKSGDPLYAFYEWMSPARFHQYDRLIRSVALEHHLDPMLVKAVVWRESRFDPKKHGTHGERGLMQVTERSGQRVGARKQDRRFQSGSTFRPQDKSGGGHLVFTSGHGTLEPSVRSNSFRFGGIQRRRQSCPAVERRKRPYRNTGTPVSSKD